MRVIFYGTEILTIQSAERFIEMNHEVIIIDRDEEAIKSLSEELDCSFLIGDASHPSILKEANPEQTDFFFGLSPNTQNNIVASLIAKSLGVKRCIVRVEDSSYEPVCNELGLKELLLVDDLASQYLRDVVCHEHLLETFDIIKNRTSLCKHVVTAEQATKITQLKLPSEWRIICRLRKENFEHYNENIQLEEGDVLLLLAANDTTMPFAD